MKSFDELVSDALTRVREIMPWDLSRSLVETKDIMLLDIREPDEYTKLHIPGSINVPRGILEQACEWDYDETVPELVSGRGREIVVICRSGKRSVLAADVMVQMGFVNVVSLRTGVRGWNDFEQPLQNISGELLDPDEVDVLLYSHLSIEQKNPKSR